MYAKTGEVHFLAEEATASGRYNPSEKYCRMPRQSIFRGPISSITNTYPISL